MNLGELQYRIGLTRVDGVGDVLAKNLIAYCGSAELVFKTKRDQLEKIPGIGIVTADAIVNGKKALLRAEQEIEFIIANNVKAISYTDPDYPWRLKNCNDSPVILYYKGNADLNPDRVVAVVGTRTPSQYGRYVTEKFIKELSLSGCLVVSGLAYGIDVAAHKSCLDNNVPTIGVLAHGLDRIYPAVHTEYAMQMIEQGGLLTEYMSETNPDKENFPKRNRIVAGMCDAVVVIESKKEGGSLITTTIANSYNRDVFAFPGRAGDQLSEGCNALIKTNRAALIESSADLLYAMNWMDKTISKPKLQQLPLMLNLSDEEQSIVNCFKASNQMHIDEICYSTGYSVSKTSACLLQLEFSNLIKSLPGKIYQINY